ncbi:unnamed protein product, partial [Rotaria magnacalcarata]
KSPVHSSSHSKHNGNGDSQHKDKPDDNASTNHAEDDEETTRILEYIQRTLNSEFHNRLQSRNSLNILISNSIVLLMDNPVFLDEEIPFVESGVYEIDEAGGGGHGTTTTLGHGNIISLNHQRHPFEDHSMWSTTVPSKRGRRPKSTTVVLTTASSSSSIQKPEPKRRGRKPKQEILSPSKSLSSTNNNNNNNTLNDILSESTDGIDQKQQRRSTTGLKSMKKLKNGEQPLSGKLIEVDD